MDKNISVLLVLLSRYLFVFYGVYFLKLLFGREKYFKQRVIIFLMNITAFALLIFDKNTAAIKQPEIYIGVAFLVLLTASFIGIKAIYRNSCQRLWNCMFFLMSIGLIVLTRLDAELASRQILWLAMGLAAVLLIPFFFKIVKKPEKLKYVYIAASALLLLLVFFFSKEEYGAVIGVSIGGFSFQPSEIVKLIFTLYLAAAFHSYKGIKDAFVPTIAAAAIVLFQVYNRDLGGALIFFITYMMVMYAGTGNIILFFAGISSASLAASAAYRFFSHVRVRVAAWSNPWADPTNMGYQTVQGFFAIGTYGLLGSGLTLGQPYYISVVERDYMFAAICEELGSLFGIIIILIYIAAFYLCFKIALNTINKFYALMITGVAASLAIQTFLILGGIVKLVPLTGVTMPFVSYGGSSVTACIFMIGLVQSAKPLDKPQHDTELNALEEI